MNRQTNLKKAFGIALLGAVLASGGLWAQQEDAAESLATLYQITWPQQVPGETRLCFWLSEEKADGSVSGVAECVRESAGNYSYYPVTPANQFHDELLLSLEHPAKYFPEMDEVAMTEFLELVLSDDYAAASTPRWRAWLNMLSPIGTVHAQTPWFWALRGPLRGMPRASRKVFFYRLRKTLINSPLSSIIFFGNEPGVPGPICMTEKRPYYFPTTLRNGAGKKISGIATIQGGSLRNRSGTCRWLGSSFTPGR